jgi:hypothetical protein
VLAAVVKFCMDFRSIGPELSRMLHMCVCEQREVRGLFVSAVLLVGHMFVSLD